MILLVLLFLWGDLRDAGRTDGMGMGTGPGVARSKAGLSRSGSVLRYTPECLVILYAICGGLCCRHERFGFTKGEREGNSVCFAALPWD